MDRTRSKHGRRSQFGVFVLLLCTLLQLPISASLCFTGVCAGALRKHGALKAEGLVWRGEAKEADIFVNTTYAALLEAARSWKGYEQTLREARLEIEDGVPQAFHVGPMPSIIHVLTDILGKAPDLQRFGIVKRKELAEPRDTSDGITKKASKEGGDGILHWFSGDDGQVLVPSLPLDPILKRLNASRIARVKISVAVNSDVYNRGLGIGLDASEGDISSLQAGDGVWYAYNSFGVSEGKQIAAIKFHPGMRGGQLRIEGHGGFHNQDMGFTPSSWTNSGQNLHKLSITLGADGCNEVTFEGTESEEVWSKSWTDALFDGQSLPAIFAWMDLGAKDPLFIGPISFSCEV